MIFEQPNLLRNTLSELVTATSASLPKVWAPGPSNKHPARRVKRRRPGYWSNRLYEVLFAGCIPVAGWTWIVWDRFYILYNYLYTIIYHLPEWCMFIMFVASLKPLGQIRLFALKGTTLPDQNATLPDLGFIAFCHKLFFLQKKFGRQKANVSSKNTNFCLRCNMCTKATSGRCRYVYMSTHVRIYSSRCNISCIAVCTWVKFG